MYHLLGSKSQNSCCFSALATKNESKFFFNKFTKEFLSLKLFELHDKNFFSLKEFDEKNFVFWLLIFLLIFDNSADFDGWIKLIKSKEKNITFFDKPEINLKI